MKSWAEVGDTDVMLWCSLWATVDLLTSCQKDCLPSVTPDCKGVSQVASTVYLHGYQGHG